MFFPGVFPDEMEVCGIPHLALVSIFTYNRIYGMLTMGRNCVELACRYCMGRTGRGPTTLHCKSWNTQKLWLLCKRLQCKMVCFDQFSR